MLFKKLILVLLFGMSSFAINAEEPTQNNIGYYGFEPDIITNYVSMNAKKVGFVRVTVELMIEDTSLLSLVEHHSPLLRDAIIDTFIRQPEQKVKSMTGREEVRVIILDRLRELMKRETGREVVRDVLFAKYLYH
jgi:flagellar FliL protein